MVLRRLKRGQVGWKRFSRVKTLELPSRYQLLVPGREVGFVAPFGVLLGGRVWLPAVSVSRFQAFVLYDTVTDEWRRYGRVWGSVKRAFVASLVSSFVARVSARLLGPLRSLGYSWLKRLALRQIKRGTLPDLTSVWRVRPSLYGLVVLGLDFVERWRRAQGVAAVLTRPRYLRWRSVSPLGLERADLLFTRLGQLWLVLAITLVLLLP